MRRPLWLLVLLPVLGACGVLGPTEEGPAQLAAAQVKWASQGPGSYVYAVVVYCFCPEEYRGPVRVSVEDGSVTERVYVSSGLPVPEEMSSRFPRVEGLFEVLHDAYERDAHEVTATYDADLGVPLEFSIDYIEYAADEELGMAVTETLAPLP